MSNLAQQETFTFSIQALQYGNKRDDIPIVNALLQIKNYHNTKI